MSATRPSFLNGVTEEALHVLLGQRSPTGAEMPLAIAIVEWARRNGVEADLDPGPGDSASVVLTLESTDGGDGGTVVLYAPIDTLEITPQLSPLFGNVSWPTPWNGVRRLGPWVAGEGAENPKGYAAAVMSAMAGLRDRPRSGRVKALLCGGSLPSLGVGGVHTMGLGSGLLRLLQRGVSADAAIACKPGWSVAHEEVGVVWLRIRVVGAATYVGFRHKSHYANAISVAGRLAGYLDEWLAERGRQEGTALTEPQGAVSAICGGIPELAAFVGRTCDLHVDVRFAPGETQIEAVRSVERAVEQFMCKESGFEWSLTTTAAVPASRTDETSDIIVAARRVWEELEGRPHEHVLRTSGASDTSLLRTWGIPTARVGLPLLRTPPAEFSDDPFGMNVVNLDDCSHLAALLSDSTIEYWCRVRGR